MVNKLFIPKIELYSSFEDLKDKAFTLGTLLVAPRRSGKTTFLTDYAIRHQLTYYTPNYRMADLIRRDNQGLVIGYYDCENLRHIHHSEYFCVDEVDFMPQFGNKLSILNHAVIGTTGRIDFDRIQFTQGLPFGEYNWVKHIVIVNGDR